MLDDPEGSCRVSIYTDFGEIWWRRIKCLAELSLGHAGREVATNTHSVVVARSRADKRLIVQLGYFDVLGAHFDGAVTRHS
ncbi:hypothetical protein A9179_10510 [Pseudomonas alcaligenes]|uniref:Uncharacterized protein n=1 Tax=Aquipseudomonas alcaligenes TaxID=43263 RepID=A0ABR7S2U9_AQUAC|nr:hypothetical protein [Pseudomonas alcaligenes]